MFTNLRNAIVNEIETRGIKDMQEMQEKGLDSHTLRNNLTELRWNQLTDQTITLEKAKEIATKKLRKECDKEIADALYKMESIENANEFTGCTISVEWKSNRTWGRNPRAELTGCGYIAGSSIGGCGYDKESTAIADVLNQSYPFLKKLYEIKDQNIDKSNRELFGYGSGYGLKPYYEGGTGASCLYSICEKIGMEWVNVSHGRNYDVYEIRVKGEK